MIEQVLRILRPPVFPHDEDKTRKARYANVIALAFLAIGLAFELGLRFFANYVGLSILDLGFFLVLAISMLGLVLLRRGQVRLTSILLVVLTWVASNGLAATGYGAKDSSYLVNFPIILMAGLLLSWQASAIMTIFSVLSGLALAYAEQNGLIRVPFYPTIWFARDIAFVFGLNGVLMYLLINGLQNALKRSRKNLQELESANSNLNSTQNELRQRSDELVEANEQLQNRTLKLHAIAMVTRTAASIQDFDRLLTSITGIISKELGYYHVGLFLLDDRKEFALLRSTNTEDGLRTLNSAYRVPVGQMSPIGFVAQTGQPQIVYFEPENLSLAGNPATLSEIVLPLKSGDQIIGVLDIHSVEANAFVETDIATLSILADQVAITIQNSFLYEQSLTALRKAGIASIQATSEAWKAYEKSIQTRGYFYDGIKSEPLKEPRESKRGNNALLIPVELRGQTIGRFKLNLSDPAREWTEDELAMIKATADRVALALESARLLDEAQKRATREAFLSDVATKLSASFQLDSILRDTVQELGQTLKNSTVTFQLIDPESVEAKKPNSATAE